MFYPMLSDYGSFAAASQAQSDAISAQADAREARTETELMRHDIDRLLMITEALWICLKKQHGYSDEDLTKVVTEIDMRDGRLDGKSAAAGKPTVTCPGCGKINSAKRPACMYCGAVLPVTLFVR